MPLFDYLGGDPLIASIRGKQAPDAGKAECRAHRGFIAV